jgi:glyoxylase I family protein
MQTTGLHHVALNVHDLPAALDFYVGKLGFATLARPAVSIPGAWLGAGDSQIHLIVRPEAVIDGSQHLALRVDDLDATVAELEAAGISVRRSNYLRGAGRQAVITDPSGNRIELNQPEPA